MDDIIYLEKLLRRRSTDEVVNFARQEFAKIQREFGKVVGENAVMELTIEELKGKLSQVEKQNKKLKERLQWFNSEMESQISLKANDRVAKARNKMNRYRKNNEYLISELAKYKNQ